jgi:poly(A)-specific ribonuclease
VVQDTLQEFNDAIHDLFPKIIDTKYLATHAGGDLNASPTLQDIAESLSNQPLPNIVTHVDHSKYHETEKFHEAGYDSLLTATIMLRLAAKIGAERSKQETAAYMSDISDGSFQSAESTINDVDDVVRDGREKVDKPVPLPPVQQPVEQSENKQKKRKGKKKKGKKAEETDARRFHTKNIFDSLRELRVNPEGDSSAAEEEDDAFDSDKAEAGPSRAWDEEPVAAVAASSWQNEVFVQDKSGWVPIEQSERHAMEMIPRFDSAFWNEFGNTLRVFGTEETVLKIANW